MNRPDAYLFFDGNCAEAMRFYERVLGGKIDTLMTAGESPEAANFPPESRNRVLHSHLAFDSGALMASDWMAPQPFEKKQGFSLSVTAKTVDEGKRLFDELSAGGHATMPFGKSFWSEGFGMLIDQFGTPWMVSVEHS